MNILRIFSGGVLALCLFSFSSVAQETRRLYPVPVVDLSDRVDLQVLVDKEKGQYLGHPTTLLLEDGKTILCVYPKGHGAGTIILKKSTDGGETWSERLETPQSWATSKEVPTLYPTVDAKGVKRLLMFSGMQDIPGHNMKNNRMAISEDNGASWSELEDIPNSPAGTVAMSDLVPLRTGKGHYIATYHAMVSHKDAKGSFSALELYVTFTKDGGKTWSQPQVIFPGTRDKHLCEGGFVRSPDGKQLALLLRENSRCNNSQIMYSRDEGKTWTPPRDMPHVLNGDRHQALPLPDGRLFIQFRDASPKHKKGVQFSPTEGDWCAWVGTWRDLVSGKDGQYRVRLKDNRKGWDTAYPAAELLPDGTLVCTSYGHFDKGEASYILSLRFKMDELDGLYKKIKATSQPSIVNDMGDKELRFDPGNAKERAKAFR